MKPGQEIVIGNVKIKPLYIPEVECKLPEEMKEHYRETGKLKYENGEVILTSFGARHNDEGKIFAVYVEEENDKIVALQEMDNAKTDYLGYSIIKNLHNGSWQWMRSIEDLQKVITCASEINEMEKLSDQKVGAELLRRRQKDKKTFLPSQGNVSGWDGICG